MVIYPELTSFLNTGNSGGPVLLHLSQEPKGSSLPGAHTKNKPDETMEISYLLKQDQEQKVE